MNKIVNINTKKIIGTPNPKMWGIFYEEINHAGEGGIYAELIRNRNFSESDIPEGSFYADGKIRTKNGHTEKFDISNPLPGWNLIKINDASGCIEKTKDDPRNIKCSSQLKMTFDGKVRLVNGGYWGINVKKQNYYGFIIAKSGSVSEITVGLMRKDKSVIGNTVITGINSKYNKYEYAFDAMEVDEDARFFIEANGHGVIILDFVSLFAADTYKGEKYGFRADLVEALNGLKPGFMRFPGGCVVEGIDLANAIHWKDTIGPIEDRPGHWDLWDYRCTDGLGMLEFCRLAEHLKAELMYVVNCGMSCQYRSSELAPNPDGIDEWLQNALDGVEYICGATDTKWGAKRAEDGHPEPFDLKYVEIGNENWGDEYAVRYKKFSKVFREKYPNLTLISDGLIPDGDFDLVDDHYYTAPQTFPGMYDRYNGDGKKVYVGEYACNSEVGYGNLLSAISDATFMTHMENRCDRVRIASYAPLFCNDNDRKWPVNLINFDRKHVFGIPSYYVQKLFGNNVVENVVYNDCEVISGALSNLYVTAGIYGDELVIKAANFGPEAMSALFKCDDIKNGECDVWTVSGENEKDTNSLLYPENVKDVKTTANANEGEVSLDLAAWSFIVIRIKI